MISEDKLEKSINDLDLYNTSDWIIKLFLRYIQCGIWRPKTFIVKYVIPCSFAKPLMIYYYDSIYFNVSKFFFQCFFTFSSISPNIPLDNQNFAAEKSYSISKIYTALPSLWVNFVFAFGYGNIRTLLSLENY